MDQAETKLLVEQITQLNLMTWVQIWLAIACFFLLAGGIILGCINRGNLKRLHRSNTKRFEALRLMIEEKRTLNNKILSGVESIKGNGGNNSSNSESHGGNMKGGHQTVNITTQPDKTPVDFQKVFLDKISELRISDEIRIKKLEADNLALLDKNKDLIKAVQNLLDSAAKPTKNNHARDNQRTNNRRTQT